MTFEQSVMTALRNLTPAEMRQTGELLLALADSPRDATWKYKMDQAIAAMPTPPKPSLMGAIEEGNKRVQASEEELWATGWHPAQMRAELERLGYTGTPGDA